MSRFRCVCALGVVVATIFMSARSWAENLEKLPASVVSLNDGWQIQSSCEAKATGQQVSTPGFEATGWHKTTVPNTVVGTLVDDRVCGEAAVFGRAFLAPLSRNQLQSQRLGERKEDRRCQGRGWHVQDF